MKFPTSPFKFQIFQNKTYAYIFSFSVPLALGLVFLLLSFRSPELPSNSALNSFSNPILENVTSLITYKISDTELVDLKIKEAFISKMEQTKGLFSKNLNMSVTDQEGNLVALMLNDFKNGNIGSELNEGVYFGKEHQDAKENYSIDLGTVVFSSSSSLILEDSDGSSAISRNGWIKISKSEKGLLSGQFEFEIIHDNDRSMSIGSFDNVKYILSE